MPQHDPMERAIRSAENEFWTIRPPEDIRRLVAMAIRDEGRDKTFWVVEALRAGLAKYAGKKSPPPAILKPLN